MGPFSLVEVEDWLMARIRVLRLPPLGLFLRLVHKNDRKYQGIIPLFQACPPGSVTSKGSRMWWSWTVMFCVIGGPGRRTSHSQLPIQGLTVNILSSILASP